MTDVPLTRSVRLIFEFTADGVRLLEQHPVNVTVGLFRDQDAGDYVEVRNRDGRTISRVPVWAGIGSNVETFPEDPYISSDTPRVLTVVVPSPPDADHVAVVRDSRANGHNTEGSGTEVLGTFRLSP
ncbi:hypothetical protein [Lentzea flava]|uniref:Uncharacterized protein n=1 Tax=Lentzea flava TaxID=103732 RepID=A0ABQ2V4I4_9PSEU|nr:hypothetical protein [Lentzea flava]MCP2202944.1 hypothetical protein [Lentzea flava]GGU64503.1 hypothetical protein GCM10010178_65630 [Lentzea flava]